jgi:hypothetical protein
MDRFYIRDFFAFCKEVLLRKKIWIALKTKNLNRKDRKDRKEADS